MKYINYRNDDGTIETIEAFGSYTVGNMDRRSRINLLNEYRLNDSRYYGSNRASKAYYESLKENKELTT